MFPTNPIAPGGPPATAVPPIYYPPSVQPPMFPTPLPMPGGPVPVPPIATTPPITPEHPVAPLPPDVTAPPGTVTPPIYMPEGDGKAVVLVYVPGVGYRYVIVDTTLKPVPPIAATPAPKK